MADPAELRSPSHVSGLNRSASLSYHERSEPGSSPLGSNSQLNAQYVADFSVRALTDLQFVKVSLPGGIVRGKTTLGWDCRATQPSLGDSGGENHPGWGSRHTRPSRGDSEGKNHSGVGFQSHSAFPGGIVRGKTTLGWDSRATQPSLGDSEGKNHPGVGFQTCSAFLWGF